MKLLICGANGQLGQELKTMLTTRQAEIGPISAPMQGVEAVFKDVDTVDFANFTKASDCLREVAPDIVINCAAMTNVNACETEQDAALLGNAILPRNLAVLCQDLGAKLVHVSTDYVFPGDQETPRKEWDLIQPKTVYGKSKALGEAYVQSLCQKSFIVRTAWLYGYQGHNFVKTICKLAKEKGQLKVVNDQFGNPTHANDLACHLLALAATEQYGLYHCTNEGICSWYEFACEIVTLLGVPCEVTPCTTEEFTSPAPRPAFSALDNAMLRCTIGNRMRPWREALAQYMQNAIEQGLV